MSLKHLIRIIYLTIVIALGTTGTSWGADYQKGVAAYISGDYVTALREWSPLAQLGDARAQFQVGALYDSGEGVPQNYKIAMKWFTHAAEQGRTDAMNRLGIGYRNGQGVLQDYVYAHMWTNIAAASGNPAASLNRDIIAKLMTPTQIEKAQELARECVRKEYKGC
jgi:uncharacterized protein